MEATKDDALEVARWVRDVPPVHYTYRIESFSLLSKSFQKKRVDKYESSDFEVGGYKWRLVLYPNGNTESDANDHISLYLEMSETNDLPLGWEVHAFFKFLVFDQIRNKYLVVQMARERRFHAMKTQWGIPRLISLSTFNDPTNGYLIDDCCVFGVDAYVTKSEGKGETLSMIKEPKNGTFTWKLNRFSEIKEHSYLSEGFTVGGCQWKLELCPKGDSQGKKENKLSLFLNLVDDYSVFHPGWKVHVGYKLRIKDQVRDNHYEGTVDGVSFSESILNWGYPKFISLRGLYDANKGFLANDTLIVEVEIYLISVVNYFAQKHNSV